MTADAPHEPSAAGRRWYAPTVLGLLVAGGAAWLAAGREWARVTLTTEGLPPDTVVVTGREALPLVAALAVVVVTSALAVLATRGVVRRVVGAVVVIVASIAAVVCLTGAGATDEALRRAVEESPAFTGAVPDADAGPWRLLTAIPFLLAAALGVVVVVVGARWPGMSGRYEAPAARRAESDDPWTALDEGRDPTV